MIEKLDFNKYGKEVTTLYMNWWGHEKSYTKKQMLNFVKENADTTYVYTNNDELIGVYQILKNDLDIDNPYTPWLANIFVKEEYRGKSIGSLLIKHCLQTTKKMGYTTLYLHSRHENLYEKFGFELFDEIKINNQVKRIYRQKLDHN